MVRGKSFLDLQPIARVSLGWPLLQGGEIQFSNFDFFLLQVDFKSRVSNKVTVEMDILSMTWGYFLLLASLLQNTGTQVPSTVVADLSLGY